MTAPVFFRYGARETEYLSARDPVLGRAIAEIGPLRREINPDAFSSLVNAIVGQQISTKAQITVWNRVVAFVGRVTPGSIAALSEASLASLGMSGRKARYIRSLADKALSGDFDPAALCSLGDEDAISELVSLDGVGPWTAEMLLIFSLGRPNVFSFGDAGIRSGLKKLHGLDDLDAAAFARFRELYSPHCTVASFYLWEIAGMRKVNTVRSPGSEAAETVQP